MKMKHPILAIPRHHGGSSLDVVALFPVSAAKVYHGNLINSSCCTIPIIMGRIVLRVVLKEGTIDNV